MRSNRLQGLLLLLFMSLLLQVLLLLERLLRISGVADCGRPLCLLLLGAALLLTLSSPSMLLVLLLLVWVLLLLLPLVVVALLRLWLPWEHGNPAAVSTHTRLPGPIHQPGQSGLQDSPSTHWARLDGAV
jgi:hypothetical protein